MMARRTRSLNELPGHLRVPILRRKDTERTKERLAAGLAGMEELKSLRQHQQQLVGETMAKAEDRQDRRQGEKVLKEKSSVRHGSSPVNCAQTNCPPRDSHRRSWSSFRGHSMDSISEEGDGMTRQVQLDDENGNPQWDINNNNNNNKEDRNRIYSDKTPRDQVSLDTSKSRAPDPSLNCVDPDPAVTCHSPIYQSFENETKTPVGQSPEKNNLNPTRCRNRNDTVSPENLYEDNMVSNPVTPSRRRSMSEWHSHKQAPQPVRHRSMSVDMGQKGIQPFQPLSRSSSLSKNNKTNKFPSLSCISTNNGDANDTDSDRESPLCFTDGSKRSQSMSQINDIGHSRPASASTLKRRGSLTWDSLLKSIGIQNSSSSTSIDTSGLGQVDDDANDDVKNGDSVFESESDQNEINKIVMMRKKGRSMSFTCGRSTNSLMSKSSQMHKVPQKLNSHNNSVTPNKEESSEADSPPPQSIHPILRRASIQCEAVLTKSSRVVNPIKDVDVNSFKSPGPLHAVMLQYRGYGSPPLKAVDRNINSSNVSTHALGTQEVSNECPPATTNIVKSPLAQSSKAPSNLPSHLAGSDSELILKSTPVEKQDQAYRNVIQKDSKYVSTAGRGSGKASTKDKWDTNNPKGDNQRIVTSNTNTIKEQNEQHVNGFNKSVKSLETLVETGETEPVLSEQTDVSKSQKGFALLPLCSADTNNRESHSSENNVTLFDNKEVSSSVIRKTEEKGDGVSNSNLTQLSSEFEAFQNVHNGESSEAKADLRNEKNPNTVRNVRQSSETDGRMNVDRKEKEMKQKDCEISNHCVPCSQNKTQISYISSVPNCQIKKDKQTMKRNGNTPYDSSSFLQPNGSGISMSGSQLRTQQIAFLDNMEDKDVIRGKRSSIFSDVSLMSDSSGKTPSSSASVLSDISIVSDEGYSTWDSMSPESKFTCLTRSTSVSRPTSFAFSDTDRNESDCYSGYPGHKGTFDSKYIRQGNNVSMYHESFNDNNCDKQTNHDFHYDKEMALEHTSHVILPDPSQKTNIQNMTYRKSCKQTTV